MAITTFLGAVEPTNLGVAIAEPGGGRVGLATHTILVGPEGGWSDEELSSIALRVGLGSGVLRAETAAVVAGTLLVAARSGMIE
jgi:hypothetical protein